ncbi:MAG: aryl-sulfate sulfotransferase, partial [Candidatus Thorarchaeota archaeon]
MRKVRLSSVFFLMLFLCSIIIPLNGGNSTMLSVYGLEKSSTLSDNLPTDADRLQDYADGMTIRVYDEDEAMPGLNVFSCSIRPNISVNRYEGYLLITDMEGNIVNGFHNPVEEFVAPRMVNSTTIMFSNRSTRLISFWNWLTNETVNTNAPAGHHEWDYNPITGEFAAFVGWEEEYYNEAENETYPVSYDDLGIFDKDGNLLRLWSSNTTFPFNYTEFSLRNEVRRGEYDWMHSNSIFWDVEEGAIYMSVRHLDASVKIDATTMETDWVVGRYPGEADPFTLYDKNGEVTDA